MDDSSRIALVRVGTPFPDDSTPAIKYQLGDHLGSSNVVISGSGDWVNREEFTPYGETSFGSFRWKRYRFTGKEKDEESGLNYHGARYYAPWVLRWMTCDPVGMVDGLNLYLYARNHPVSNLDSSGKQTESSTKVKETQVGSPRPHYDSPEEYSSIDIRVDTDTTTSKTYSFWGFRVTITNTQSEVREKVARNIEFEPENIEGKVPQEKSWFMSLLGWGVEVFGPGKIRHLSKGLTRAGKLVGTSAGKLAKGKSRAKKPKTQGGKGATRTARQIKIDRLRKVFSNPSNANSDDLKEAAAIVHGNKTRKTTLLAKVKIGGETRIVAATNSGGRNFTSTQKKILSQMGIKDIVPRRLVKDLPQRRKLHAEQNLAYWLSEKREKLGIRSVQLLDFAVVNNQGESYVCEYCQSLMHFIKKWK